MTTNLWCIRNSLCLNDAFIGIVTIKVCRILLIFLMPFCFADVRTTARRTLIWKHTMWFSENRNLFFFYLGGENLLLLLHLHLYVNLSNLTTIQRFPIGRIMHKKWGAKQNLCLRGKWKMQIKFGWEFLIGYFGYVLVEGFQRGSSARLLWSIITLCGLWQYNGSNGVDQFLNCRGRCSAGCYITTAHLNGSGKESYYGSSGSVK